MFLILDSLSVHHSRPVKDRIEVLYLPGYSPELNPDERINANLKYGIASRVAYAVKPGRRRL